MKDFISEADTRKFEQLARLERGRQVLAGLAGTPRESRKDGYVNLLNKYGTSQDNSTAYTFDGEAMVPDIMLTQQYESGGLFAKIIDIPSEEAVKHGFDMNLNNPDVESYVDDSLDWLEWEEKATTAIKWARLYGGSIMVMLIDDGRGIDEPLDWQNIRSVDELRVYERAIVQPDYASLYNYDPRDPIKKTTSRFAMPEFYNVYSIYGSFRVHESRCLIFRNGILPERTTQANYRYWGMPEYTRIKKELREAITSHSYGVKILERSVQAIYSMKGLANLLATEDGENSVLKRLQVIDMARGILNSIAIDSEGENYDFKNMQLAGVKDVIDTTCNMLSAVTNIPQTLLFGRSPAGENSTGASDLENYYNHVERIQKLMLRSNLKTLLDVILRAGLATGKVSEEPDYKLKFVPLWSMSEAEQATVEQTKAQTSQLKAQTAQIYVDMQAVDPSEVRRGLAKDEEFAIEDLLDDSDIDEEWGFGDAPDAQPGIPPKAESNPETTGESLGAGKRGTEQDEASPGSAAVLVMRDGKVLIGKRKDGNGWCGPGGHIEAGETPGMAAIRETQEEFGITANELIYLGTMTDLDAQYGTPVIYLCTDYDGEPKADGVEMEDAQFKRVEDLDELHLFPPFVESVRMLLREVKPYEKPDLSVGDTQGRVKDRGDFDESKHPRDKDGRFTSGSGSGGASHIPYKPKSEKSSKQSVSYHPKMTDKDKKAIAKKDKNNQKNAQEIIEAHEEIDKAVVERFGETTMTTKEFVEKSLAFADTLTEEEKFLDTAYTGDIAISNNVNTQALNIKLREGHDLTDEERAVVQFYKEHAAPLGKDTDLYRMVRGDYIESVLNESLDLPDIHQRLLYMPSDDMRTKLSSLQGKEFTNSALQSTSPGVQSWFKNRNTCVKIKVPGNVPVCLTTDVKEGEVVIPTGAKMRITHAEYVEPKAYSTGLRTCEKNPNYNPKILPEWYSGRMAQEIGGPGISKAGMIENGTGFAAGIYVEMELIGYED